MSARTLPATETSMATPIALFEHVGRDHALTAGELSCVAHDPAILASLWEAYERHWRRFCGAQLDPQFSVLDHPAQLSGTVVAPDGAPVVVVGTGPSLRRSIPVLQRVRDAVHIFTSPRGADALAEVGIVPDLVLVEHQTSLDAHFSARERSHRPTVSLSRVPCVAADTRTPAALLSGVSPDRLFVPEPLPTWGLWPATAVALAVMAGARATAILGIDLGAADRSDPAHAPLVAILEVLAAHAGVPCLDVGLGGAKKRHWPASPLERLSGPASKPLGLDARPFTTASVRYARASAAWQRTVPIVEDAASTLRLACVVRDGDGSAKALSRLQDGLESLLRAGDALATRRDMQEGLGVSFLPRYWRMPPDPVMGRQIWRPAALASHELLRQHEALGARLKGLA